MLDRTSFSSLVRERLADLETGAAVELHLHGGESFYLRSVKRMAPSYALCELVPLHEGSPGGESAAHVRPREAAVPYATIATLAVSADDVRRDGPLGFLGLASGNGARAASRL